MKEKKCLYCLSLFFVNKKYYTRRKYCSIQCGELARAKISTCKICHKDFKVVGNIRSGEYCSLRCHNIAQSKKLKCKCKFCNKIFFSSPTYTKQRYSGGRIRKAVRYCSSQCRYKDKPFKKQIMRMNKMQQLKKPNKLEIKAYQMLDSLNIKYSKQTIINNKFTVDALVLDKSIILQFDGDYWHGNPQKFPVPDKRQQHRISLDKSQDAYLKKCGYKIIRWWEHEIYGDLEKCKNELLNLIK